MNVQSLRPEKIATCAFALACLLVCTAALCACTASEPSNGAGASKASSSAGTSGASGTTGSSGEINNAIETIGAEGVYVVALDYNAGTGYEWQCAVEPEGVFSIVGHSTQEAYEDDPNDPITGGPLVDYVTVRATAPGTATLTCSLERPWEGEETAEVQTFTFTVDDALGMEFVPDASRFTNYPEAGSNS